MVQFSFTKMMLLMTVLAAPSAQSEIISGQAHVRTDVEVNCLVRYHGLISLRKHHPDSPQPQARVFDSYLETGKAGEHGASLALKTTTADGLLRIVPMEFIEADFGLKFELSAAGNATVTVDGTTAFGDVSLSVTDLVTGNLVGSSDFPIEQMFAGGYSIAQITVGLAARLIESQKIDLTWDKDLLTQARFQCN